MRDASQPVRPRSRNAAPAETREDARRSAEALILEHLPDIATLCRRMFRQPSDADDATHEAVLAVLRARPSYRGDGPVRHWVLKVALNAARQHRRARTRRTRRETELPASGLPGVEMPNPTDARDEQEALRSAIAELPDDVRESVTLYYLHRLTQTEIARCMGCSQKTVHVRIRDGLARLGRRLVGSSALGAMAAAGGAGAPVLDSVSPALVASVKQSIAGHFAQTGVAAASAGASLTTTAVATGGLVMNTKLIAGASLLAVVCLVGGAALSGGLRAAGAEPSQAADVAVLERTVHDAEQELEAARTQLAATQRRADERVAELNRELTGLRRDLGERERELAALRGQASRTAGTAEARETSRAERWAEIQESISGVMGILRRMEEDGANQFELGPRMVAELGKLTDEEFERIIEFDEDETDPEVVATIRAVMLQALIFVPRVAPHREAYMARYLERVRGGAYGDDFTAGALRRLAFRMPPFVDAYGKIVEPLDADLRREFVDVALRQATDGVTDAHRLDGVLFLARSPDPRATETLTEVLRQPANPTRLRSAAARGLAERADADVLRVLRDVADTETDPALAAQAKEAAARVEKLLAAGR